MTIFKEGRYRVRALCAALAAIAGRAKNCVAQGLTRAEGIPLGIMPDRRIAGSPDRRIAGMSALAWLRRPGHPASRPEPSATGGSSLSPARALADFFAIHHLRFSLAAVLLSLATGAQAQTAPYLEMIPNEIQAHFLHGATITLIPKNATFFGAGGGGSTEGSLSFRQKYIHPDDQGNSRFRFGEARFSAAGLALITLSGAPPGLTIASGKLLQRERPGHPHGRTLSHRSAQITLAYDGSLINLDDPVTVTVAGGTRSGLLRFSHINETIFPPDLSATFTIKAASQFLSLSLDRGKDTCSVGGGSSKTYTCVKETDSAPKNVEFQVKTEQLSSSPLPFRLCFSGSATRRTGGNAEQDDYLIQERVGSAWQTRNSGCVDSSIAANQQLKRFRIQVLGDNHHEQVPMWIDGQERLVISGQETVRITLNPNPAKPLPSPYGIDSVFRSQTLVIDDDDYHQQPLAFGTWAGKPGVREGRPSLDQDVGIPFSAQAGWDNTVTYRVVPGNEDGGSTATYGTDYRLRGGYNRNTNRGTMTLPKGKTLASLPITVIEDELIEDTETVVLEMVSTGTHTVGSPDRITVHIEDDEATPLLKVDEHGTVLRDGVDSGHRIKMSLTPVHASIPDRALQVDAHFEYCVTSSATLGDDYTLARPDGTKVTTTGCYLATLPKGELGTYLDLTLFDDGASDEPDEWVKIRLQRSTVSGKETTDLLEIPDSTRTADETISTVITIKDDLPVLAVSGYDDTSKRDRRFRAIYTIRSVNGALRNDLYVKWEVEDTGGVVDDNRKRGLGKSGYKALVRGFSEFTVPISIRHDAGAGSATFKVTATGRPFRPAPGSHCVRINGGLCPVGNSAPAVEAPDTGVSNLRLATVDDASASVTWDAVAHATSYDVSWDANGSQTAISGVESVTGTTAIIRHEAQEAMTLTVTVTPEYIDGNGAVQQLDALAATATLAVGPGADALSADAQGADSQAPSCVSDALLADAQLAATETWRTSPGHVERWSRVLAAFGESNAWSNNPMTIAEAQAQADRGLKRWAPVAPALECLENPPQEEHPEQAEVQPVTPTTPELSLRAGSAVDEGGNAGFTITADPAPQSDLTIAWTVAQSGEYLDAPGAGHRTVVLTAGTTSIDLSVATVDDAADEADGSVSVTLGTGTGYTVATSKGSAAVAVRDNDEPTVSIAAGSGVTEGMSASFTVSASPVPAAPLDVTLTVAQSGDFAASGETGSRTVTVPVTGSATFEVATVDDGADEPDGSITATLGAGTGYTVAAAPDNAATVAMSDNDAASSGPTLSIADATFNENAGRVHFTVTLSEPADRTITVRYATRDSSPVSAVAGQDYLAWKRSWQVWARFRPGETETQIFAYIYNDSHDEDPETFEMVLFDASDGVSIADGVAVGTIINDDPMPAAWLARFGRTAAEQALDGIAGRIAASRSVGVQGSIAGQALNFDPGSTGSKSGTGGAANDNAAPGSLAGNDLLAQSDVARAFGAGHGGAGGFGNGGPDGFGSLGFGQDRFGGAQSRSMTAREALLGSSFTATGEKDGTGGSLAFWGRAAQSSFDGREGTFSLDGEATTAMLGADYARGNWLVGMALMQSSGEGGYADRESGPQRCPDVGPDAGADMSVDVMAHLCGGAVREGDGKVEASLTAAVPYAAVQASERLKLWGAAGYGTGEVTLKPEVGGSLSSDISWTMAAAGLRGDVMAPPAQRSGLALAVTSDALWARTSSDKTHELAASDSDVTRLRVGLEGSYRIATEGRGHVTPKLEAGMRQDGGDAETGFGVEVGGGLAWVDPTLGLSLDVSGRTLIAHGNDDLKDRGFAASLAFDPDPASERGLSLALRQEMGGQAKGGLDALFRADPLEDHTGSGETAARWQAEAAYGFPAFSGRFTGSPHMGLGLATGTRDYSLGWRLTPAANANTPDISFGLKATRRESDGTVPEHSVGFEVNARW